MDVKLVVANGKFAGKAIPVIGPKFFIGRAEDCQLRPASELVSRHHCVIIVEGDYVAVRDFGSKNGTYVNGQRVRGEIMLKDGDTLTVGVLEFTVRTAAAPAKPSKPKVESVAEAVTRTAAQAASTDFDVDSWLEDESKEAAAHAETKTIEVPPASARPASLTDTNPPHDTPEKPVDPEARKALASIFSDEEQPPAETSADPKKKDESGKFKKPQAASSDSAAANVLKNLFRRT
ncbi:MAG: FHA domain-containing protein [Thermogutta sp.]|nr:FHA domain-containing protein [Thermogutta sp.]